MTLCVTVQEPGPGSTSLVGAHAGGVHTRVRAVPTLSGRDSLGVAFGGITIPTYTLATRLRISIDLTKPH
jgi:hypothetical protein